MTYKHFVAWNLCELRSIICHGIFMQFEEVLFDYVLCCPFSDRTFVSDKEYLIVSVFIYNPLFIVILPVCLCNC